jgi:hypothetical protein
VKAVPLRLGIVRLRLWTPWLQGAIEAADSTDMRPWIILALLAGSMVATARHLMGHRHTVLIPLLLVPALALGWMELTFRSDQDSFSEVATTIAGRDVSIECQRFGGALLDPTAEAGYVQFDADGSPSDTGRLERDACNNLRDYLHGDKSTPPLEQVIAAQVLAHESYHLAGVRDEARTECSAVQRLDDVAMMLGATPEQARSLAKRYFAEVYPNMPSSYRSGDCVDDGDWDAAPDDPEWP